MAILSTLHLIPISPICVVTDQFKKVQQYYQESSEAEEKCNTSVSGPLSPVEQSKQTRSLIENLLNTTEDKFLHATAAQNKSIAELQQKAHELDQKVHHLSHQVRGGLFLGPLTLFMFCRGSSHLHNLKNQVLNTS